MVCQMPSANAFSKMIGKLLKKFVSCNQRDWNYRLGECLRAYRITVRISTKSTPFSLLYGCEVVIPLKIQIPSLRVALMTEMTDEEKYRLRLKENHLQAQQQIELYQTRSAATYNKKVKIRSFKKGDLVLMVRTKMVPSPKVREKFQSKWRKPFVVETIYLGGAYRLVNSKVSRSWLQSMEDF